MTNRVLVVDDEPQILRAVERALAARGYEVATAADGRAALGMVHDVAPDLVVLDLNLPHLDGLTVCREIRRSSAMPILVLSVRDAEQDKIRALDLGADDYLTKPFGRGSSWPACEPCSAEPAPRKCVDSRSGAPRSM